MNYFEFNKSGGLSFFCSFVSLSLIAVLKFFIAAPKPVAISGKRLPPNNKRIMINTSMSSQNPIPNIYSPSELETEILLAHSLRCERLQLRLALSDFRDFVKRRAKCEPLAYIVGYKEFFGRKFRIDHNVLIPRPETEKLVEIALRKIPKNKKFTVLELGLGSGCIAATIAIERPLVKIIGSEISYLAANLCQSNIALYNLGDQIKIKVGHLFDPLFKYKANLVIANLPYINISSTFQLMHDVVDFEPPGALYGTGRDGLNYYKEVLFLMHQALNDDGVILLEIDSSQASFFIDYGKIIKDDFGLERIVEIFHG